MCLKSVGSEVDFHLLKIAFFLELLFSLFFIFKKFVPYNLVIYLFLVSNKGVVYSILILADC